MPGLSFRTIHGKTQDIAQILIERGGGIRVNDAEELKSWINRLLAYDNLCSMIGGRAEQAVMQNSGVTERTIGGILKIY